MMAAADLRLILVRSVSRQGEVRGWEIALEARS
jgi:hypothetical protein